MEGGLHRPTSCTVLMSKNATVIGLQRLADGELINHIISCHQENRSTDHTLAHCVPIGKITASPMNPSMAPQFNPFSLALYDAPQPIPVRSIIRRLLRSVRQQQPDRNFVSAHHGMYRDFHPSVECGAPEWNLAGSVFRDTAPEWFVLPVLRKTHR